MVHGIPSTRRDSRPLRGLECAIMHAECAGVSGPGYYAAEPRRDVPDVSTKLEPSGASYDHGQTCRTRACQALWLAKGELRHVLRVACG